MDLNLPGMDDGDLPTLDTIIKGFEIIANSSLDNLSYTEVKQLFEKALLILPKLVAPNATIGAPLYRVTDGLFAGFDKNKISSFSHPPPEYCKRGRANLAGFPVFYAALSGDTALREIRNAENESLKNGNIIYISEWKIKKEVKVSYAQFLYDESVSLGDKIIDINTSNREKLAHISSIYSDEKQRAFKLLMEKIGNLYILDKAYFASSFLSHYLLYEDRDNSPIKIDVLIYPSVQASFKGINYAFHPDFVRENIELKAVRKVSFNSFHDGASYLNFLELGLPNKKGQIKWYTINLDMKSIKKTNKNILLFDNIPPKKELIGDIEFYSDLNKIQYNFGNLITLGWNKLKDHSNDFLGELVKIEGVINHKKIYKKTISVDISNENIFANINDIKYNLKAIAFEVIYKLRLEGS
ncbi:hypothetical protein GCM10028806_10600 [Spirosoma terrae]|uniref:RES family NAD+ phosphorylase n=1 Tax=Spirosoma terrae TaxID=1968276 RepID=A0A6L9LFP3_9BACT|nr:RES family NAD+ phosphorylase [Spirosoma terrae]NDU99334.1 RES family NAD+ phosphorylase [Spirosoma terrae]